MKEEVIKKKIGSLSEQIEKKQSELEDLLHQRAELEDKLTYSKIGFRIICSDSSFRLCVESKLGDEYVDVRDACGRVVACSPKEIRKRVKELFDDYVNNQHEHTICTCSSATLNMVGELICLYKICPNNIEVILYDDDNVNGRVCHFSRDGYLVNWPIGALD